MNRQTVLNSISPFVPFGSNLVLNPGFEDALVGGFIDDWVQMDTSDSEDILDWFEEMGGVIWVQTASHGSVLAPHGGTNFSRSTGSNSHVLVQDVDVSAHAANIDLGIQQFRCSMWVNAVGDTCRYHFKYLDATKTSVLANLFTAAPQPTGGWVQVSQTLTAPVGTRYIRVVCDPNGGGTLECYYDDVEVVTRQWPPVVAGTDEQQAIITMAYELFDVYDNIRQMQMLAGGMPVEEVMAEIERHRREFI